MLVFRSLVPARSVAPASCTPGEMDSTAGEEPRLFQELLPAGARNWDAHKVRRARFAGLGGDSASMCSPQRFALQTLA